MSTASDPRTWTERELTHAWRELMTAWREEVATVWPSILKMVVVEQMIEVTARMLDADVTNDKGRAAYYEAKGERAALSRMVLPGFGLEDRIRGILEKAAR